jgi:hypothetical protein
MPLPITRVSDRKFQFSSTLNDKKVRFSLKVEGGLLNAEARYHIAAKAAKQILASYSEGASSTKRFRYGDKNWKISRSSVPWWKKVLAFLLPKFVFQPSRKDDHQFTVDSGWRSPKKKKKSSSDPNTQALKQEWKRKTNYPYAYANYKRLKNESVGITPEQYQIGVRAVASIPAPFDQSGFYTDPFTHLSTLAFQKYEFDFVSHDKKTPETTDYRLIKEGDKLLLVHRYSPLATEKAMREALDLYREFILKQYGHKKFEYIDHLYNLQLENLNGANPASGLTPEHVYRFNIGTLNIEMQDIQDCIGELRQLYQETQELDPSTPLTDFSGKISGRKLQGLCRLLLRGGKDRLVTLSEFRMWAEGRLGLQSLTNEVFKDVLTILRPAHEEMERAYTGRKIHGVIQSGYTIAERAEFKPWVDQQELAQTMEKIIKTQPDWTDYLETLSHVVVKKHLERHHKQEGYRIGALIPAPAASPGEPIRWYQVTSSISNGGIHSYTLESAVDDPSLPVIKLYRSTATSTSAMRSDSSVKNNLNLFNSPGYRGIKWLEKYEKSFFHDRTIPIWVGYQYQADQLLHQQDSDLKEVFANLKAANQTLLQAKNHEMRTKTLREVLKEHDTILDELYHQGKNILPHSRKSLELVSFAQICERLIQRYMGMDEEKVDRIPDKVVKKDAKSLYNELAILYDIEKDACTKNHMLALMEDLKRHIFHPSSAELSHFHDHVYQPLKGLEDRVNELLQSGRTLMAKEEMESWSQKLKEHAKSQGENIESKRSQDLIFAGHSLGGACAQAGMTHYVTDLFRIPLPQRKVSGFLYDDPKINRKSNQLFKEFGNQNHQLFHALGIRFEIIRRQEAGDIVPLGGEEHLGAAYTTKEEEKLNKWLRFDAAVSERLTTSQRASIAHSEFAHATRFGGGKRLGFRTLATWDKGPADYKQIHYSPKIQGIFDRRGHDTDLSPKRAKEIYRDLHRRIWKISNVLEAILREELRKSLSFIALCIRKWLFGLCGVTNHVPQSVWVDDYGVLAVNTSGVASRKIVS